MTPSDAKKLCAAINDRRFATMGLDDIILESLEGVSLSDMLEAKRLVQAQNDAAAKAGQEMNAPYSLTLVPDDRLIAAVYCLEHYQVSDEAVLVADTTPTERRKGWGSKKALGVIALQVEGEKRESA